ncbi:MAG: CHAT domain-containing protein, partial [Bacteroidales bacterium]|nr:CHAT domain-containing protein [Bacteroidales bacterium]
NAILHFRLAASFGSLNVYQYRVFGESYWKADSIEQAEAMLTLANKLAEENVPIDKKELAETHFSLGALYLDTKRNPLVGLFYLNLAVGEFTELFGPKSESLGRTLLAQAKYFIATGELEKALEIIQSSIIALSPGFDSKNILDNPSGLQLNVQSTANSLGWKALALANYYQTTKDIVYLKASFNTYVLALKMVESFRLSQKYSTNLILNKEVNNLLNQAILVSNQLYGLTNEDLYFQSTFSFIEKNKSTALLSSLQQNDSLRLANVPKYLVLKENNLKQDILSLQEKINQLLPEPKNSNANLLASYIKLRSEYQQKLDSIQLILVSKYPDYYRLFYGNQSISIANVQEMLADNQVLLDYSLTDTLLLVYAISKEKTQLVTKAKNSAFTNSIQRLLQLIRHVNTDNSKSDFNAYTKLAWENYQFLLGDLNEFIAGKDVLIVPDGILSYLPFDVLLTEEVKNEQPNYRNLSYFVFKNTSSFINSAAIYFSYSQKKKPNYGKIIAFAPVYSLFDTLSSGNEDRYALMPLVHVKEELQSINSVFIPILFQGKSATKANFIENADHASILHLAMHAVLNDEDPLRSQLVFAPNQHDRSASLFEVEELFGMKLNADLAVLSACNSGNGKLNTGEGILSLSTGFQYAGVPSVVMSHWDVNDKYSAVLMTSFYNYLAQGMGKNQALHQAKVDLLKNGNSLYSHPYYWAGFTLIGNESAVVSLKSGSGKVLELAIPFVLIAFMFYRKRKFGNG